MKKQRTLILYNLRRETKKPALAPRLAGGVAFDYASHTVFLYYTKKIENVNNL